MTTGIESIAPWLGEMPFLELNREPVEGLWRMIGREFPGQGAEVLLKGDVTQPSVASIKWQMARLLGHQHGLQEGIGGKLPLTRNREEPFWPAVGELRFGDIRIARPYPIDRSIEYDKGFAMGGTPQENTLHLLDLVAGEPESGNVRKIIMMAGQRLRWDIPGERSTAELYTTVAKYSGADMERLRGLSPYIQQEEAKSGDEWLQSFATEFHLGRLSVEAVFRDMIDWENYDGVHTIVDLSAEAQTYDSPRGIQFVPAREDLAVIYPLKDGREVYVVNGKALPRPQGIPRPNSDTQTRESVDLLTFGHEESVAVAASAPHTRAAVDAIIRILDMRIKHIKRADVVNGFWIPGNTALLAALGEIPTSWKADTRLRAVLRGESPDTPELSSMLNPV